MTGSWVRLSLFEELQSRAGHERKVTILGLDVHAETIAVAIAEPDGEVRSLGTIANREDSVRKLIRKLGPVERLRACYERRPDGIRSLLAVSAVGSGVCGGGAVAAGAEKARGPRKD